MQALFMPSLVLGSPLYTIISVHVQARGDPGTRVVYASSSPCIKWVLDCLHHIQWLKWSLHRPHTRDPIANLTCQHSCPPKPCQNTLLYIKRSPWTNFILPLGELEHLVETLAKCFLWMCWERNLPSIQDFFVDREIFAELYVRVLNFSAFNFATWPLFTL